MRARLVATRAKIDDVARADDEAAQRAIAQGKPMPKAKLPRVQDELAEAERELAIVAELVRPSAETLLAAALEVAADVEAKADADEAVETVLDHLRSARESLEGRGDAQARERVVRAASRVGHRRSVHDENGGEQRRAGDRRRDRADSGRRAASTRGRRRIRARESGGEHREARRRARRAAPAADELHAERA